MKDTIRYRVLYYLRSVSLDLAPLYSGFQLGSVRDQLGAPGVGPGFPPLPGETLVDVHVNVREGRQDEPTSCVNLLIGTCSQVALKSGDLSEVNPYVQRFPRLCSPGVPNDELHQSRADAGWYFSFLSSFFLSDFVPLDVAFEGPLEGSHREGDSTCTNLPDPRLLVGDSCVDRG